MSADRRPTANHIELDLPKSESNSSLHELNEIKNSRSEPSSSKKRYQANRARRKSRSQSLHENPQSDDADWTDASVRFSVDNLVDRYTKYPDMTFPRPLASISVSRVASASSTITEPTIHTDPHRPEPNSRLRPSIISLFGRIVSRSNSNADSNNMDGETGIRARILRAFSYVGKDCNFRWFFFGWWM